MWYWAAPLGFTYTTLLLLGAQTLVPITGFMVILVHSLSLQISHECVCLCAILVTCINSMLQQSLPWFSF